MNRNKRTERLRRNVAEFLGGHDSRLTAEWSEPRGAPVAWFGKGERRFTDVPSLRSPEPEGFYEIVDGRTYGLEGTFVNKLVVPD